MSLINSSSACMLSAISRNPASTLVLNCLSYSEAPAIISEAFLPWKLNEFQHTNPIESEFPCQDWLRLTYHIPNLPPASIWGQLNILSIPRQKSNQGRAQNLQQKEKTWHNGVSGEPAARRKILADFVWRTISFSIRIA